MRRALNNLQRRPGRSNTRIMSVRVTSDEGDIGRGHLRPLQELETMHAGDPHYVSAADHRRGRADLQEHRASPASSTP